ncbi:MULTISPECIES: cell surface composition regulator GlgS [Raoultella]|uniref:Surface composition regulator n=1 Tax=Raoultella planticola TaxID=575 RepID=A0A2C5V2G0_RAOPL|nr:MULTISPECIES: cell surface composition regulator GlgS [Raoultella]ATM03628.1 cell surface composition regulator GlgS [Raoultella planticola]ATM14215.1 cell surface composition regulator GlgS [Raoultella planticola]AUU03229.1 cell surface composition regulator GlgS [Raoultella planticola]EIY2674121.1 cell surface composition regulator GlgS [Raoultella planticola]EJR0220313.1 cell surface composition regulator GlgS [Raoultella planticola]
MNHHELYSMKNFDFLALSFARMYAQGHAVDLQAIVGNMDEAQREWFCQRYELYCRQVSEEAASEPELEH